MFHGSPLALAKKSAGKIMTTKVPTVNIGVTVGDTQKIIIKNAKRYETVNYIYVTNTKGKLVGVCSIKELFAHTKTIKIAQIMKRNPVCAHANMDQEKVAYSALKNNLKAMPIVNKKGGFLGVMESDDISRVIYEETREDVFHSAGVSNHNYHESVLTLPLYKAIKNRIPWLIIGLFGGILAAKIVEYFEETISENIILVAFIPLVVYMADATKVQMEAFMIRDISMNPKINFRKYLLKQLMAVSILATIISLMLMIASGFLHRDIQISLILGIGLFCAMMSSLFSGLFVPYFFSKIKVDPANASGPIATIIQDIISIIIYFLVATALL